MRLVISHCLPRDCDFARQGIARLRLRSTLTGESDLRLFSAVGLCRLLHLVWTSFWRTTRRRVPCF
mgnify:CR=1 FL=1